MTRRLRALLPVLVLAAGGCAPPTAVREPATERVDLRGVRLVVGSGRAAGHRALGALAAQALRAAGARVVHRTELAPGAARDGLESGRLDVAWQYTGTAWARHLGHRRPIRDEQGQYRAVKREDLARNGIRWLPPAPGQRTRALAFGPRAAGRFAARTLSELVRLPRDALTVCLRATSGQGGGWLRGLERRYGFRFRGARLREMDPGAVYAATATGECHLGQVVTTDPRIRSRRLTVLHDDRHFFGPSSLSLTVRDTTYDAHSRELRTLFGALSPLLTTDALVELNAQVEVDGGPPGQVARRFLTAAGVIRR